MPPLLHHYRRISADKHMNIASYEFLPAFDGISLRSGHWQTDHADCRGTVVLLGGRTEFVEKYLETIDDLLQRGFDVFSMDWRGQGLSDRLLSDATKGYVETYEHYIRDLEFYLNTIVLGKCRRPLTLMAHSMGASVVLHFLKRFPKVVDNGVLMSPMIDLRTKPIPYTFARWCSRFFVRLGIGGAAIPSLQRNDTYRRPFRRNWLTHDPVRFRRNQALMENDSRLAVSSVTYGWLAATFAAIDHFRRPDFFNTITTPLLLVTAGRDRVVSNQATHCLAGRIPSGRVITIAGAHHEILQEGDGVRDQFWQAFDRFMGR